jgi:hypothetical protein
MKNFPEQMSHASGTQMSLDPTRILLVLKAPREPTDVKQFLHSMDLFLEDEPDGSRVPGERVNHTRTRFWAQSRRPLDDGRLQKIEEAGAAIGLDFIGPVYRLAGEEGRRALMTPLPNVGIIKLREPREPGNGSNNGNALAAALGKRNGGPEPILKEIQEKSRYLNGYRYYQITNARDINAYQLRE